jgi:COP9 signalosome complex subunit 5
MKLLTVSVTNYLKQAFRNVDKFVSPFPIFALKVLFFLCDNICFSLTHPPSGSIITDDTRRVEQWGACWNRYYKLDIEYFMSTQAKSVISILSKNYMWMRTLGSTPMIEPENKERVSERILNNVTSKLNGDETSSSKHGGGGGGGGASEENPLTKPVQSAEGLAVEMCEAQMTQLAKKVIFG